MSIEVPGCQSAEHFNQLERRNIYFAQKARRVSAMFPNRLKHRGERKTGGFRTKPSKQVTARVYWWRDIRCHHRKQTTIIGMLNRTQIILQSTCQRSTTWRPDQKLGRKESGLRTQRGNIYAPLYRQVLPCKNLTKQKVLSRLFNVTDSVKVVVFISIRLHQSAAGMPVATGLPYRIYLQNDSPDVILCGWVGSKHQLTNSLQNGKFFNIFR